MSSLKVKPFGLALGLMGNFAMAWGISQLVEQGSCGDFGLPPCPESVTWAVLLLVGGIFVSMASIFLGGSLLVFLGIFISIGIGSLVAGFGAEDPDTRSFGIIFGAAFAGVPLLLIIILAVGALRARTRFAKATALVASGAKGVGTVTEVRDTGVTINDNPRVEIVMRVVPEDGGAPLERRKTVTVSRVAIPRTGDRFPVWFDRGDPDSWAYGTDLDAAEASADVQALFARAAAVPAPAAGGADELAKLGELRAKGVLTDAEFEAAKARLLRT